VAESALAVGGIVPAASWEARLLEDYSGASRSVRLVGATGSEVVTVEFF